MASLAKVQGRNQKQYLFGRVESLLYVTYWPAGRTNEDAMWNFLFYVSCRNSDRLFFCCSLTWLDVIFVKQGFCSFDRWWTVTSTQWRWKVSERASKALSSRRASLPPRVVLWLLLALFIDSSFTFSRSFFDRFLIVCWSEVGCCFLFYTSCGWLCLFCC